MAQGNILLNSLGLKGIYLPTSNKYLVMTGKQTAEHSIVHLRPPY